MSTRTCWATFIFTTFAYLTIVGMALYYSTTTSMVNSYVFLLATAGYSVFTKWITEKWKDSKP